MAQGCVSYLFLMCFSALVNQHAKNLGFTYKARVQIDMFEDLFKARRDGQKAEISSAMEAPFLEKPKSASELRIAKYIRDFHVSELKNAAAEIKKQEKRLAENEKKLAAKYTKTASEECRKARGMIERQERKIERFSSEPPKGDYGRIFPFHYAPLITFENGEKTIRPFRYQVLPSFMAPELDGKWDMYNARRPTLLERRSWKQLFGQKHGAMEIKTFFENVPAHKFERRGLKKNEIPKNMVLRFEPKSELPMLIACLFDANEMGEFPLHSFTAITDDPNPEIEAAGHDRMPIAIKPQNLDIWLPPGKEISIYEGILLDKQPNYYENEAAA